MNLLVCNFSNIKEFIQIFLIICENKIFNKIKFNHFSKFK